MAIFQEKLKQLRANLRLWNHTTFGKIFRDKSVLEKDLELIQRDIMEHEPTNTLKQREEYTQKNLDSHYEQEEILWRKKSRIHYLKEG